MISLHNNKKYKHQVLVIGSEPFGKSTYEFLKSFDANVAYFDTKFTHWWIIPLKILRYTYMLFKCDAIYKLGYFRPCAPYYLLARILNKKIVIHWIGSEVLDLNKCHYWPIQGSFSVSNNLTKELNFYNINSLFLPLYFPLVVINKVNEISPSAHSMMFYLPKKREEFYGLRYLILLADTFKDIQFYVVGSTGIRFPNNNIVSMGYLNDQSLNELIQKVSIYVRITKHDGLSQLMLKSLSFGKIVVTNTEHPHVIHYNPLTHNEKDLVQIIKQLLVRKPKINKEGIDYIKEMYEPSLQFNRYQIAFRDLGIEL